MLTLSHGSVKMQHKQRLETQVLMLAMNGIEIDIENGANARGAGENSENPQLWGLDEESGCIRSKTSEYVSLPSPVQLCVL